MARTRYIKLCSLYIVLDQRAKLEYYSASSHKQQSMGIHVIPLGHVILIPRQPVFVRSLLCSADSINKNNKVLGLTRSGLSNPPSTAHEVSTLTTTPPMWLIPARIIHLKTTTHDYKCILSPVRIRKLAYHASNMYMKFLNIQRIGNSDVKTIAYVWKFIWCLNLIYLRKSTLNKMRICHNQQ